MSLDHSVPETHCSQHRGQAAKLSIQTPSPLAELPTSDAIEASLRQSSSSSASSTTKTSLPCSHSLTDKEFFTDMDCTHSKLITFLAIYRWFSTDLPPDHRNACPTCLEVYPSFQHMLLHLVQCPKAANGEYWCWDCCQWEMFQQSRCRENRIPGNTSKSGLLAGFKKVVYKAVGKSFHRNGGASRQLPGLGASGGGGGGGADTGLHQHLQLDHPGGGDLFINAQFGTIMNRHDPNLFGLMHHSNDSGVVSSANTASRPSSEIVSPISTDSIRSRPGMKPKRPATRPPMPAASHVGSGSPTEALHLSAGDWQLNPFATSMMQKDNGTHFHHHCAPHAPPRANTIGFALPYPGSISLEYQEIPELEGGQCQPAVELAAANPLAASFPPPPPPPPLTNSLLGSQPVNRSSRVTKLWESFSRNFGEMSGNPIRGQDPGDALISGLDGLQMALSGTGQLLPRMLIGLTHLIAAMAVQVAQDLPSTLYSQAISGVSHLDPMHSSLGNIEAMKLVAGYYLDALEVQGHMDQADDPCVWCSCAAVSHQQYRYLDEGMTREFYGLANIIRSKVECCKESPARHMELALLNLYISDKLMSSDLFFESYLPKTQRLTESSYCACTSRLSYRLRTLDKIRQEVSCHTTHSPSPDPTPLSQRQASWDSSTAVESNIDSSYASGSPNTLSGSPTATYLDELGSDGTPRNLPCPFGPCDFSTEAAGRAKILRRHVQMEHLPVKQVFVCKHVEPNGGLCGKEYKRKDYARNHWKEKHTGALCMERVMRVRDPESFDFQSDPNTILVLNRGTSLWHLGPYWDF